MGRMGEPAAPGNLIGIPRNANSWFPAAAISCKLRTSITGVPAVAKGSRGRARRSPPPGGGHVDADGTGARAHGVDLLTQVPGRRKTDPRSGRDTAREVRPAGHAAGPDQDYIAVLQRRALLLGRPGQVPRLDAVAIRQAVDATGCGDVEQDRPARDRGALVRAAPEPLPAPRGPSRPSDRSRTARSGCGMWVLS